MTILVLMTHYCPWSNAICSSLADLGHDIHVFDFVADMEGAEKKEYDLYNKDADLHRARFKRPYLIKSNLGLGKYLLYAPKLRKIAKEVKADLILSLYGGGFAMMAYLSGIRPYAVYVVGSDVLCAGTVTRRINRAVLQSAAAVFANGAYLAAKAEEQAPGAQIKPLLIGTNLERLKRCDFDRRPVQIICTRAFSEVYNNEAIVRALSLLPEEAQYKMIFVSGGGTLNECVELADRIMPPKSRGKIEFLGGVPFEQLLDLLSRSHIFVSMSRSDGTSTAVLEAMGAGLYPVLSDIPQNGIFKPNGKENCSLVPLDDDEALAGVFLRAIQNVEECASYSQYNRELILNIGDARKNRGILAADLERTAAKCGRTI